VSKVELIVPVIAAAGKSGELKQRLLTMLEPTHGEKGCEFYRLYESQTEGHFYFHEMWESEAALEAHTQTPHFKQFMQETEALMAGPLAVDKVKQIS